MKKPVIHNLIALTAVTALLVGCSAKAPSAEGPSGGAAMGPGVTADTITLGNLSDLSAVYGPLTQTISNAIKLYFDERNANGGICGRNVVLDVRDHAYDVQKAVSLFAEMEPNVLGFVQLHGSPMVTALGDQVKSAEALAIVGSWSSQFLGDEHLAVAGTTYPVDVINGLDYAERNGLIAKGDTIGHVYFPGDFGEDAYRGSQYYAAQQGISVKGIMVEPKATDYTAQIAELKSSGVKAVVVSGGPAVTSRVALGTELEGLKIPILANSPGFDPALIGTDAGPILKDRLYVVASNDPFDGESPGSRKITDAYNAAYPGGKPTIQTVYGYGVAGVFGAALDAACEARDLTREGVTKAFRSLSHVETGVMPSLDFTNVDRAPSSSTLVLRVDPTKKGGLRIAEKQFESDLAVKFTNEKH